MKYVFLVAALAAMFTALANQPPADKYWLAYHAVAYTDKKTYVGKEVDVAFDTLHECIYALGVISAVRMNNMKLIPVKTGANSYLTYTDGAVSFSAENARGTLRLSCTTTEPETKEYETRENA